MIIDEDTGEILKDRFAKMFFDDYGLLLRLKGKKKDLLLLMVKHSRVDGSNSIYMTPLIKKRFMKTLDVTTTNSISNMLRDLCKTNAVKRLNPQAEPYKYTINPELFFKGNDYSRAEIIVSYSDGDRKVSVRERKGI